MTADAQNAQSQTTGLATDHSDKVRIEQTSQLFEHLGAGIAVSLVNAAILVFAVRGDVQDVLVFAWLGAIVLVTACRAAVLLAYRRASEESRASSKWKSYFDAGTLAVGLTWGATAFCAFAEENIATQMFLGFVLGGMAAGAISTLAIDFRTYLLFLVPSLLPFTARLFAVGAEPHLSMGAMVTLFVAMLVVSGRRYQRVLLNSLDLRNANTDLVDELRTAIHTADEASRAKSLFLANMSHEIRTPMNGVFGMTDLLKRTALSQRQLRLVDTINQSAKTLLTIINDILDLSRIEAGKLELDNASFDLRHCVEGAAGLFGEEAERKDLDLTVFVAGDVPEAVKGDPVRLRQIIVNLIGNAIKFTDKGAVSIQAIMIKGSNDASPQLQIDVRDNGIGIDATLLKRIQAPFVQADSSINRRFGGTGLGLSISKHLVTMMNGAMDIKSVEGSGTCITLTLPLEEGIADAPRNASKLYSLDARRVLVVDDHDTNREILRCYLEDFGANVTCVTNAADALDILENSTRTATPFDAAILDVVMPNIDGLELTRRIKAHPKLRGLPLVMVTSLSWKGDTKKVREMGVNEFMTKPVRRNDVVEAVYRAISTEAATEGGVGEEEIGLPQFKGHVLIVEDNPVNKEVAEEYVTSFGCTIKIASNGLEAVTAVETFDFDLIFMDCQMPEMDGFMATQKIRALEQQKGGERTPIVALTANAFEGDRQACLDAGMDGYISKPFTEAEFQTVLSKWLEATGQSRPVEESLDSNLISQLGDKKPALLIRMIEAYLTHAPRTVAAMSAGLDEKDPIKVKLNAHSLKSSSANLGAVTLSSLCRRIEKVAGSAKTSDLSDLVPEAVNEFERAAQALQQYADTLDVSGSRAQTNVGDFPDLADRKKTAG